MQKLQHLLQNINRQTRIALGAAASVIVLLLVLLFSGGETSHPQPIPTMPEAQKTAEAEAAPDNSELILQLFNPSDQSLTHQLSSTVFSQQIEQALTVSFVLTRCRMISQDDYADTFHALITYAERTKLAPDATSAEARVRQLAESASASYSLVYGRTPCTDPQLPILARQLAQWVEEVTSR